MKPRSLSGQLLAWVTGTLVLVWAGFVGVGYLTGAEEAIELSDAHLSAVAAMSLGDQASAAQTVAEYRSSFTVVVWDGDGRVLQHLGPADVPPFDVGEGFQTLSLGDPPVPWRTFSRWSSTGPRLKVAVLTNADLRDELAWDVAGDIAQPGLWLLPVAVVVLGLAVRRGLQPLRALSAELHALDIRKPQPLRATGRHEELRAVVVAVDALAERYQTTLVRERQLASELAHELRTPLTSIALQANALRQPDVKPDERDSALRRLEQDALRAGAVLTSLLALARASHTELVEAARAVDLTELARRVTAEYAQAALDSGHDLGCTGDAPLSVPGHPVLLELALRNLIDNALGHTAPGTRIEVQVDAPARRLQVCDDGAGKRPAGPSGTVLGFGLGHRVVDKVAAIHAARFSTEPSPAGFSSCYRIQFGDGTLRP